MLIRARLSRFLLFPLLWFVGAPAQQDRLPTQPAIARVYLEVVVTPRAGPPATGLQQQDFSLLDNKVARSITSFRAVKRSEDPLEVVLVVDAVNAGLQTVAYEHGQLGKFLRAEGGHLAHPTALTLFTDSGIEIQERFSDDGNALSASLDRYFVGPRTIRPSAGFWGAAERFQLSINALHQLAAREASQPGRKVIIWVSPGWPLLSGPGIELDANQRQEIFNDIVGFSTLSLQARITLYSIDPLGTADFGARAFDFQRFLKGISKPSQADVGDLALQVLAIQSGGLAFTTDNDIAGLLHRCLADADAYYELSFDPPSDAQPNEYHALEVTVANPGLTARTRQGYYAHPDVKEPGKVPKLGPPTKAQ